MVYPLNQLNFFDSTLLRLFFHSNPCVRCWMTLPIKFCRILLVSPRPHAKYMSTYTPIFLVVLVMLIPPGHNHRRFIYYLLPPVRRLLIFICSVVQCATLPPMIRGMWYYRSIVFMDWYNIYINKVHPCVKKMTFS